jgi:hypothetical protein
MPSRRSRRADSVPIGVYPGTVLQPGAVGSRYAVYLDSSAIQWTLPSNLNKDSRKITYGHTTPDVSCGLTLIAGVEGRAMIAGAITVVPPSRSVANCGGPGHWVLFPVALTDDNGNSINTAATYCIDVHNIAPANLSTILAFSRSSQGFGTAALFSSLQYGALTAPVQALVWELYMEIPTSSFAVTNISTQESLVSSSQSATITHNLITMTGTALSISAMNTALMQVHYENTRFGCKAGNRTVRLVVIRDGTLVGSASATFSLSVDNRT